MLCVCVCVLQPNIGRLGVPNGPSGEKVAVVAVDDCDIAMAVRFGSQIGNYSCAAQGTQTGQKKLVPITLSVFIYLSLSFSLSIEHL